MDAAQETILFRQLVFHAGRDSKSRRVESLVAFPGSGISGNLADKARQLGIPVLGFAGAGA